MDNRDIKAVFFDLGNVIICFDYMIAVKKIAKKTDKTPSEIFELFFSSHLTDLFDSGAIDETEFFRAVKDLLKLNGLDKEDFYDIWNNIFWENAGIAKLIKDIKMKFQKFFIVSNTNKAHWEYVWNKFPVVRLADKVITSFEVGALKPDRRIYNKAIEEADCKAEKIFYTDDRVELVQAAGDLGFNAYAFSTVEKLRDALFENVA